MRLITQSLVVCLLTAAAAAAQGFSQPVREMEKEARSAVRGVCPIQFNAGYSGLTAAADCTLSDFTQVIGTVVPQGKILVIEDVSAACQKATADKWAALALNATSQDRYLPLVNQATFSSGYQLLLASERIKLYARGGDKVMAYLNLVGPASLNSACTVRFSGHLVSVQ
ncbi:MAG: hypothetical protein ABI972_21375 [Acidobacteriota bacterium]